MTAGRHVLFGECLAGKDSCMYVRIMQQKSHSPVPAGAGEVMYVSEMGRRLRPKDVWELQ